MIEITGHLKIIAVLLTMVFLGTALIPLAHITRVNAQASAELEAICDSDKAKESPLCVDYKDNKESAEKNKNNNPLIDTLNAVVDLLSLAAGILAVIMIIFGGFRYVKSNGDSGKITEAKNTIVYGLVGIVVVVIARQLIIFVLNRLL